MGSGLSQVAGPAGGEACRLEWCGGGGVGEVVWGRQENRSSEWEHKAEPAAGLLQCGRENSPQTQHNGDPDAPGKARLSTTFSSP